MARKKTLLEEDVRRIAEEVFDRKESEKAQQIAENNKKRIQWTCTQVWFVLVPIIAGLLVLWIWSTMNGGNGK